MFNINLASGVVLWRDHDIHNTFPDVPCTYCALTARCMQSVFRYHVNGMTKLPSCKYQTKQMCSFKGGHWLDIGFVNKHPLLLLHFPLSDVFDDQTVASHIESFITNLSCTYQISLSPSINPESLKVPFLWPIARTYHLSAARQTWLKTDSVEMVITLSSAGKAALDQLVVCCHFVFKRWRS